MHTTQQEHQESQVLKEDPQEDYKLMNTRCPFCQSSSDSWREEHRERIFECRCNYNTYSGIWRYEDGSAVVV